MTSWQVRRLLSWRVLANSSISDSHSSACGTEFTQASSTNAWQVAQLQAPPQSPWMPGIMAFMAACITDWPTSPTMECWVPLCSISVIVGIVFLQSTVSGHSRLEWGLGFKLGGSTQGQKHQWAHNRADKTVNEHGCIRPRLAQEGGKQ